MIFFDPDSIAHSERICVYFCGGTKKGKYVPLIYPVVLNIYNFLLTSNSSAVGPAPLGDTISMSFSSIILFASISSLFITSRSSIAFRCRSAFMQKVLREKVAFFSSGKFLRFFVVDIKTKVNRKKFLAHKYKTTKNQNPTTNLKQIKTKMGQKGELY